MVMLLGGGMFVTQTRDVYRKATHLYFSEWAPKTCESEESPSESPLTSSDALAAAPLTTD